MIKVSFCGWRVFRESHHTTGWCCRISWAIWFYRSNLCNAPISINIFYSLSASTCPSSWLHNFRFHGLLIHLRVCLLPFPSLGGFPTTEKGGERKHAWLWWLRSLWDMIPENLRKVQLSPDLIRAPNSILQPPKSFKQISYKWPKVITCSSITILKLQLFRSGMVVQNENNLSEVSKTKLFVTKNCYKMFHVEI